jgi:hypothetical protein
LLLTSAAPRRRRAGAALLLAAGVVLGLGACEADLSAVRFRMPPKVFRFETTRTFWVDGPASLPAAACATDADCCQALSSVLTGCEGAELTCRQNRCEARVRLEKAIPMWMLRETPDLSLLDAGARNRLRPVALRVWRVDEGQARVSVGAGAIGVHAAPVPVQSARLPGARPVGRVPRLPVAEVPAEGQIAPEAEAIWRQLASKPTDPFFLIAELDLSLAPEARVPRGELAVAVEIELETTLGF